MRQGAGEIATIVILQGKMSHFMWTPLRKDIDQVRRELNIPDHQFRPVGIDEWKDIQQKIADRFCNPIESSTVRGLMNHSFKTETYALAISYNYPFDQLLKLVNESETIWLIVDDDIGERTKLWFYEGKIDAIVSVLQETSFTNEILVASKKYEWLICIDHHDYIIASGEEMPGKLRLLEETTSQK